ARCWCAVTARPAPTARSTTRSTAAARTATRTAARSATRSAARFESEATKVQASRLRCDHTLDQTKLSREGIHSSRRTRRRLGTAEMRQELLDLRPHDACRARLGLSRAQGQTRPRRLLRGRRGTQLPQTNRSLAPALCGPIPWPGAVLAYRCPD